MAACCGLLCSLQLIRMQATLQFIVLQHGVDTLALFLHLLLLAAAGGEAVGRDAQADR